MFASVGEFILRMLKSPKNLGLRSLYPLAGGKRAPTKLIPVKFLFSKDPPLSYINPLSINNLNKAIGS